MTEVHLTRAQQETLEVLYDLGPMVPYAVGIARWEKFQRTPNPPPEHTCLGVLCELHDYTSYLVWTERSIQGDMPHVCGIGSLRCFGLSDMGKARVERLRARRAARVAAEGQGEAP